MTPSKPAVTELRERLRQLVAKEYNLTFREYREAVRDLAATLDLLEAENARLREALAESDRNAEKLEAVLDPHIAWEGEPPAAYARARKDALEEATIASLREKLAKAVAERDVQRECKEHARRECESAEARLAEAVKVISNMIAVADRKTVEFDRARIFLATLTKESTDAAE